MIFKTLAVNSDNKWLYTLPIRYNNERPSALIIALKNLETGTQAQSLGVGLKVGLVLNYMPLVMLLVIL